MGQAWERDVSREDTVSTRKNLLLPAVIGGAKCVMLGVSERTPAQCAAIVKWPCANMVAFRFTTPRRLILKCITPEILCSVYMYMFYCMRINAKKKKTNTLFILNVNFTCITQAVNYRGGGGLVDIKYVQP